MKIPHLLFGKDARIIGDVSRIEVIIKDWGSQERNGQIEIRGSPLLSDGLYEVSNSGALQLAPDLSIKFKDMPKSRRALYFDGSHHYRIETSP